MNFWSMALTSSVFAVVCSSAPDRAFANDSTAVLAAGGLELSKSNDITILSERLRISPSKVTVDYEMQNTTDKPVETTIAFPMPALDGAMLVNVPVEVAEKNEENFLDFKTVVDGTAVAPKQEVKAFQVKEDGSLGPDVTAQLSAADILMSPVDPDFYSRVQALPMDVKRKLVEAKLLYGSDTGDDSDYTPLWSVRYTYYSPQRFEPKKVVRIHHEYKPASGTSLFGDYAFGEQTKAFCMDAATEKAVRTMIASIKPGPDEGKYIRQRQVDYVLKTGANWAGPIKSFELTIAKEKPSQIVSLCGEGFKKVSDTEFKMTRTDFTPTDDLSVAFYDASFD